MVREAVRRVAEDILGNDLPRRTLGRTGLRVSRMALGGGGKSCLGRKKGRTEAESVGVVRRALELGVNLFDTSPRNGTEEIIGRGIRGYDRDDLVLSTKASVSDGDILNTSAGFRKSIDESLKALGTPHIDILHLYGVRPNEYEYAVAELLPVMENFREAGKIRYLGLTEHFDRDRNHRMLGRALADDYWDVVMVGFNMVNQSARNVVFREAREKNLGILGMHAVRRVLASSESFRRALNELRSVGEIKRDIDVDHVIKRLTLEGECRRPLADIAYRYCRDEPAIDAVLVGTGDIRHLEQNDNSFSEPPLADDTMRFIAATFGCVSNFSGN